MILSTSLIKKKKQLFKHNQIDHVNEIKTNKKLLFEFIFNSLITELKILRKYVKNNFKKILLFFFDKDFNVIRV